MLKTRLKLILLMLIVMCGTAYGADTSPSDQSLKELLRVTDSHKMVDSMMGQYDALMKNSMQQMLKGESLTPKQQKFIDDMQNEIIGSFKEEMTWEKLEPLYMKVYRDTFTQEEVDGMLAFYRSPAGQAVIHKMPLVIRNSMTELQKMMLPILQRTIQKEKAAIEKMEAGATKE